MTKRGNRAYVLCSSIERVTGWTGAQADEQPSAVSATKPSAKHITGPQAQCFDVSNGGTMPKIHTKSAPEVQTLAPLELKFATDQVDGRLRGYASAFDGEPDFYNHIIKKGAYSRTIAEYYKRGTMPGMYWGHNPERIIGKWIDMHEDDYGLHVIGQLNLQSTEGQQAYAHLKAGDLDGLSVGTTRVAGGFRQVGKITEFSDIELHEISLVSAPANLRARVKEFKSLQSKSDLIDMLRDGGLSKAAAQKIAAGGWSAMSDEDQSEKAIALANQIKSATALLRKI